MGKIPLSPLRRKTVFLGKGDIKRNRSSVIDKENEPREG